LLVCFPSVQSNYSPSHPSFSSIFSSVFSVCFCFLHLSRLQELSCLTLQHLSPTASAYLSRSCALYVLRSLPHTHTNLHLARQAPALAAKFTENRSFISLPSYLAIHLSLPSGRIYVFQTPPKLACRKELFDCLFLLDVLEIAP